MAETHKGRPVLVTTEYRGVFFGYAEETSGETIKLTGMRNCIYWDSKTGGFAGLAEFGPGKGCRIGARVDGELRKVTGVFEVTPTAAAAWETSPCYKS